ncbi:MAG: hypothetical protein JO100_11095 [Pseudonocardia sp.]|jgi:hypothetical protein|nr:hypothetical protein [Pseudonocardia sp.]
MAKLVTGTDGRTWTVRRRMVWTMPATGDDFEHDMDGGRPAAIVIVGTLALFYLALLSWKSAEVPIPFWIKLAAVIVLLFFPVRWLLRRPWTLVAQTPGSYDKDREHWVGTVRGVTRAREETKLIIRSIRTRGTPAWAEGPLQLVS